MLLGLNLKNFAIIDDLSINFGKGLNIITGETGAGKSIIVDAINIILGDRTTADVVKSGKEEAQIEALFDTGKNMALKAKLNSFGFEAVGDELLIKRVISRKGRGRIFIDGSIATFLILEQITEGIIDIFSQHEHQTLLKEDKHLDVLDEFGGLKILTQEFSELFHKYLMTKRELEGCERDQKNQIEREDFMKFQCAEIDSAGLLAGEDERLEEERRKLANAERLYSIVQEAYEFLYEGQKSVLDTLKRVNSQFEEAVKIDPALTETSKSIERGIVEVQDTAFTLRDYASEIRFDPDRLNYIDNRLQEIRKLKRKYSGNIEEILEKKRIMEEDLANISRYEERVEALREEIHKLEVKINGGAEELSEKRRKAAEKLISAVQDELGKVSIKGGKFVVHFDKKEFSSSGCDKCTFLFSANPDEEPKPLTRVVSGGELSRIMLVLKEILARVEGGSILIFDEADSGIGGAVAETVGRKIKNLSKKYQVICITHLPQIAKFADTHFTVKKTFDDNKTRVQVKALDYEERVKELARMLGGLKITEKTVEAAREMLKE
ncbi:MAG: DNA repair protein RecN [Deltaproteobacteria bacterium]|nr:DNA repair protein RecN [Deltaproteobacteria bacterium]